MMSRNREMLRTIAQALGKLHLRTVFLGGSTLELYATDPAAPPARPTIDVDCIVEIAALGEYYALEENLRDRGFVHDMSASAPICRWIYENVTVDIMPTGVDIVGFTNEWYGRGFQHTWRVALDSVTSIDLLETPYFIATKLVAAFNRGMTDLRTSKDFEDIVYILRNRSIVLQEILATEGDIRTFLRNSFQRLLNLEVIDEAITAVLEFGEAPGTKNLIRSNMDRIASMSGIPR
jgi:hypothetical protein